MKNVKEFLMKTLHKDETVVVACSGGPDSMCLLTLVNEVKEELNLKVVVAHVNHKIRKESDNEALMVKEYALKNNDAFELLEITDYLDGNFSESDARRRRYEFFDRVVKRHNATTLMTAHHGDDLMETILMRLTRGSNLSGYIGIRFVSNNPNYKIVRPLLSVTKDDVVKYLEDNNILYCNDLSNSSLNYTRNRYRHHILPFLKEENSNVHEKYLKFSEELASYEEFVNSYIYSNGLIEDNIINVSKVNKESNFIKRKCLELIIKDIQSKDLLDVSDTTMNECLKLYDATNKSIDLNNGYKAINSYDEIFITKNIADTGFSYVLDKDIKLDDFEFFYNTSDVDNSNYCICLDSSKIELPLYIRNWHHSDRMQVKNLGGTKKISDIFINSKVPNYKRHNYPILVDNKNNILWVPGLKKSQFAKDNNEKYDIIVRCKAR